MNYRNSILTAIVVVTAFCANGALAGGIYGGAGIGNTFFSSEVDDAVDQIKNIDENSTAWKIFGGFNGSRFLGVEGGYRSFGKAGPFGARLEWESVEGGGPDNLSMVSLSATLWS